MKNKKDTALQLGAFRGRSFFVRNLLIILAFAMIPVIITSVFFYKSTTKSIDNEISRVNDNLLQSISAIVDNTVRDAEIFAVQTSLQDSVNSLAFAGLGDSNMLTVQQNVKDYIKNYIYIYDYIHSVYIYSEKSNLVIENQVTMDFDNHEDAYWYDVYKNTPVKTSAIVHRRWKERYPVIISVIRPIGEEYGKMGCVVVNLDISKILLSTRNVINRNDNVVLLRHEGEVFYSERENYEYMNLSLDSKKDIVEISGKDYAVSERKSKIYDWNYVLLSTNSYSKQFANGQFGYMALVLFLLIVAVIISTIVISLYSYRPIRKILSVVDTSEEVSRIETANTEGDEISYIVKQFKNKESRNEELESELKLRMLLLNKAQTYALQAQINPHFLNNVMDTLNWLCMDLLGEENKITEIVKPLSVLLSISADTETYLIPIEEELRHVNIYTYIATIIYGQRLNFSWNINPDIMQYKILKFTLQPLIENSISHGVKPKRRSGTITIDGDFHGDGIRFVVRDDGVGIAEDVLRSIRKELADENIHKKNHLGINNVNQRLKLVFGSEFGLSIYNADSGGAVIEVNMPKVQ